MNAKKTEVMCFGFDREFRGITVKDVLIKPSTTIKFLEVKIECDLGSKCQAKHVADKVRYAAANIRKQSAGTNLKERVILYNGWIKGVVMSNGLAYLPCLNNDQLIKIQRAMNAGIRASSASLSTVTSLSYHTEKNLGWSQLKLFATKS